MQLFVFLTTVTYLLTPVNLSIALHVRGAIQAEKPATAASPAKKPIILSHG